MPDDYESNWDDLARQFGFEPEDQETEEADASEVVDENQESNEADVAKESITDFFGEEESEVEGKASDENEDAPEEPGSDDTEEAPVETELLEASQSNAAEGAEESGGDHWGSLAETFGLEEVEKENASAGKADEVLSELFVPKMEPVDEQDSKSQSVEEVVDTDDSESVAGEGEVETVEFDVQDLSDEEDDRPRRRRKKRRRRRAVIEELREELEREKEAESVDEPTDESEDSSEEEAQPVAEKNRPRRRRRRRERDDSESDSRENRKSFDEEDSEDSKSKVSKNQRRRKKRTRSDDTDRVEDEKVVRKEAKPERKFPTWEEAIAPVVEANIERTNKPKRKKRSRRKDA